MHFHKILLTLIIPFVLSNTMSAFYIQPETGSNAIFILNDNDSLLFFDGEPYVKTSDGSNVDWFRLPDTINPIATNTSSCYLFNNGDGIYAKTDTTHAQCFVFDYKQLTPHVETAEITFFCQSTNVNIPNANTIPEIAYRDINGKKHEVSRNMIISYNDLTWKETAWDSTSNDETLKLVHGIQVLPPMYLTEPGIKIKYDHIAYALYGQYFDIPQVTYLNQPIAIDLHVLTTTSVRTPLNEKERPSEATQVTGSAPLNIFFQSNPTPNVEYITWRIYKGSSLIVQRNVQDHRYEFTEYGNYRAVCYISNTYCPCQEGEECEKDSTQVDITVSESMLRVPNVFTPNGDGINDEFRVFYRSIREYHIEVYNRWGKLVYSSNDPSKGWDGTINNRPATIGAYYYVIRAIGYDADHNAKFKSKSAYKKAKKNNASSVLGVYQLSGDINLLR